MPKGLVCTALLQDRVKDEHGCVCPALAALARGGGTQGLGGVMDRMISTVPDESLR